ncbi:MAG TPA: hypothetical protein VIY86_11035, partial [Pirellulaceae bacterium]
TRTWVPLPGNRDVWPSNVRDQDRPVVVVEHLGRPSVQLTAGRHQLQGEFRWGEPPERISIPAEIGIVSLTVEGQSVPLPVWDAQGDLWLRRDQAAETDQDQFDVQVYRVVEDGIPLWLRTDIELSVSGKSREEALGWTLPQGWKLSSVESPIPVAVDELGRMKAQVRAGKWTIHLDAFRTDNVPNVAFNPEAQPTVAHELVGFQARTDYRLAEIQGLASVDVTQTTFPEKWRSLPIYQWDTSHAFSLVEKMRGRGLERPAGLRINRQCWLDEDGKALTFRDLIQGTMQDFSRLDAAEGQELASVQIGGQGQLITEHPQNGTPGVEIRTRNIDLRATARTRQMRSFAATGWLADADALDLTMSLPPGWRMLALFGADRV